MTRALLPLACAFGALVLVHAGCGSDSGESTFDGGGGNNGGDGGNGGLTFGNGNGDGGNGDQTPLGDVEAVVTTDNAFSFGWGNGSAITTFKQGVSSNGGEIFNCPVGYGPQPYLIPSAEAPAGSFLYIIAWADENVTQGTLAQFKRTGGEPIYSGDGNWQICATGKEYDGNGSGPDEPTVNDYIAKCNAGATGDTYSKGWVTTKGALTTGAVGKLAFGEANDDNKGSFPITCQIDDAGVHGIDAEAKWMWFDPEDGKNPFEGNAGNRTKTFHIFRLPADALSTVR